MSAVVMSTLRFTSETNTQTEVKTCKNPAQAKADTGKAEKALFNSA
ncbi:hypothetical protein HED48_10525 [Ochrobactrum intermedium]|nr:hypothetical protein [Brucella intermedia]